MIEIALKLPGMRFGCIAQMIKRRLCNLSAAGRGALVNRIIDADTLSEAPGELDEPYGLGSCRCL